MTLSLRLRYNGYRDVILSHSTNSEMLEKIACSALSSFNIRKHNVLYSLQMTKSREAYESQHTVRQHQSILVATRQSRSQSAGVGNSGEISNQARRGLDRDTGDSSSKNSSIPVARFLPYKRASSSANSPNGTRQGKTQELDSFVNPPFAPPPPHSRRVDAKGSLIVPPGLGIASSYSRSGRSRTRVRPSSANARTCGKPGAGRGVGVDPKGATTNVKTEIQTTWQRVEKGVARYDVETPVPTGNRRQVKSLSRQSIWVRHKAKMPRSATAAIYYSM